MCKPNMVYTAWERGRPARIPFLPTRPPAPVPPGYRRCRQPAAFAAWRPLSFGAILQAATLSAGTASAGQAEGEQWCRSRLTEVGEIGEAVPSLVRAGRPRSQEIVIP